MRITPLLLVALVAAAPGKAEAPRLARCTLHGHRIFSRMADLPRGAAEALGVGMAERGGRWNPTDDIDLSRPMPTARFIWARQSACRLEIRYEQGGFVRVHMAAILELRGQGWVVVRRQYR